MLRQQDKSIKVEVTENGFIYVYTSPGGLFSTESILSYESANEAEIAGLLYMNLIEGDITNFRKDCNLQEKSEVNFCNLNLEFCQIAKQLTDAPLSQ